MLLLTACSSGPSGTSASLAPVAGGSASTTSAPTADTPPTGVTGSALPTATAAATLKGAQSAVAAVSPNTPTAAGTGRDGVPAFSHVVVIVMENTAYADVYHSSAWPYLNKVGTEYTVATNYYAISHPSLPNYLALIGGSTFGITADCTSCNVSAPNLVDQLEASGKSWKAYMEDLPAPCSTIAASGSYAKKHDPFMYFDDIRTNRQRCANVVPLGQLATDLASGHLPDFIWITPNLCHDKHDCSATEADTWLASTLPPLLQAPAIAHNGALFITFDEAEGPNSSAGCCALAAGGHVLTVVAGPDAKHGAEVGVTYGHYSLLRTIEDAWNLPRLAGAANAATENMAACFKTP